MGLCASWVTGDQVAECCSADVGTFVSLYDEFAEEASELLFELSGRRYTGVCETTVRPCYTRDWCNVQILSRGHVVSWGGDSWRGDGDALACGCRSLSRVLLAGYPVTAISEVKIDGVIVDPATYRVDKSRWLTRVRAAAGDPVLGWPSCQAMDLPDTEEGTWSVEYAHGVAPPATGMRAAAELACQLYLSCDPNNTATGECMLPSGVTSVTRQGVTFELAPFLSWGRGADGVWRTGLRRVDLFLNSVNPNALRRRPAVFSPDVPPYAPTVGTPTVGP